MPAPETGTELTSAEVRSILQEKLGLAPAQMRLPDRDYLGISVADLKVFLLWDWTDLQQYKKESFDCDDFALLASGKNHLWFSQVNEGKASTFGIVWGDIRTTKEPDRPRYHAVNFLITDAKDLILIEPQTDNTFKPTPNSTFFFACL